MWWPPAQRLLVVDVDVADDHPARGRVREHDQLSVGQRPGAVVDEHHAAERARLDQRRDEDQLAVEMPGRRRVIHEWASTRSSAAATGTVAGSVLIESSRNSRSHSTESTKTRMRDRPLACPLGREHAAEHARDEDVAVAHARVVQVEVLQLRGALDRDRGVEHRVRGLQLVAEDEDRVDRSPSRRSPAFSQMPGTPPASRRPTVAALRAVSSAAAASPASVPVCTHANTNSGDGDERERRPRAVQRPAERQRGAGRDEDQRDPGQAVGELREELDPADDRGDRDRQDQRPAAAGQAVQPGRDAGAGERDQQRLEGQQHAVGGHELGAHGTHRDTIGACRYRSA